MWKGEGEVLFVIYRKKIHDDGYQNTCKGWREGGSRNQARLERTWELAPLIRMLLYLYDYKINGQPSLYLGFSLASDIALESILIDCSADVGAF